MDNFIYTPNLILLIEKYFTNYIGIECVFQKQIHFNKLKFYQKEYSFEFIFYTNELKVNYNNVTDLTNYININKLDFNKNYKYFICSKSQKSIEIKHGTNSISINYDLIQFLISILNRLEEYGYKSNEKHDRFELKDSVLSKESLYTFPIVDYWVTWIGLILKANNFKIKSQKFTYSISCDVDNIGRYRNVPLFRKILNFTIDIFKDFKNLKIYIKNEDYYFKNIDRHNTFDWMFKELSKRNLTCSFNFIFSNSSLRYDYRYLLKNHVKKLIKKILEQGHKIGVHYSYNALYGNRIIEELNKCNKFLNMFNISAISGRFHYLRFSIPKIFQLLHESNQILDESITFHESGGFRCGTSKQFQPFDFNNDCESKILIQPLVVMEGSLLGYSNKSSSEFKKLINHYILVCKSVSGCFSLLWHNSDLCSRNKKLFSYTINYLDNHLKKIQ